MKISSFSRVDVTDFVVLSRFERDLVTEKISNIGQAVINHGRSLKRQTPSDNSHVLWKSHWSEHLWAEDTRVADFDPSLELRMESEDLETRLSVRVVSRLVLNLSDTNLRVECLHDTKEMAQTNIPISYETFNLMEFSEMGGIQSLITEDSVN